MLNVRAEILGDVAILHVDGQIVIGTEIERLARSVLSQSEVGTVVLDLMQVSRIDARGLGLLLELREQLRSKGVEFRLMNVTALVQQILEISCLHSVLEISSEEEILTPDSLEPVM
jgi:anti-anti-sigma factor